MNDIEKRAHDLALVMIPIIYDRDYKGTNKRGGNSFEIYKDLYYDYLNDFKYDLNHLKRAAKNSVYIVLRT